MEADMNMDEGASAGPSRNAGGVYGMFGAAAQHLANDSGNYGNQMGSGFGMGDTGRTLDLVFIMDATGSMGSYLASATKNIEAICDNIIESEQLSSAGALRIGLIAYRDHPPQDHTYVVKNFGFSADVQYVKDKLKSLYASGGGDGPEAVTAALKAALDMEWRPQATKLAVLIADAPPHGIGEYGDGFSNGSPDGHDPLQLARQMAVAGIPLFMVACEPALSGYQHAADFFQGLVRITGAMLLPLTSASLLSHVIIGAAGEAMDLERLHREVGDAVAERLRSLSLNAGPAQSLDDVARELHEKLMLRNESTKQLHVESIYRDSEESRHNVEVWSQAPDLATARPHIKKVVGSRLSDKYLATRHATSAYKPYTPFPHPRKPAGSSDLYASPPSSSPSGAGASSPPSSNRIGESRKIVSDFSAFSASPGMSVGGAGAGAGTGSFNGTGATFGSPTGGTSGAAFALREAEYRGRNMGMDDDEEDEDEMRGPGSKRPPLPLAVDSNGVEAVGEDGQRIAYRQGAISFDQVRRLAMQSAYRGGLG